MSERKSTLPWEHYARAPSGMWIRAMRTLEEIRLEWQVRKVVTAGKVLTLDVNGHPAQAEAVARERWGDAWSCAGTLPLDDAFVAWSTVREFDRCAYGVQRHLVGLLAGGYGADDNDDPAAIVDWFRDMASLSWIIDGARYRIDRDHAPLEGLVGSVGTLAWNDLPTLYLSVAGREYPLLIDTPEMQRAILIATTVEAPETES
jgi:hypothetical protein